MRNLVDKLLDAADIIHKKRLEKADYVIVSSKVAKFIEHFNKQRERKEKLEKINKLNDKN